MLSNKILLLLVFSGLATVSSAWAGGPELSLEAGAATFVEDASSVRQSRPLSGVSVGYQWSRALSTGVFFATTGRAQTDGSIQRASATGARVAVALPVARSTDLVMRSTLAQTQLSGLTGTPSVSATSWGWGIGSRVRVDRNFSVESMLDVTGSFAGQSVGLQTLTLALSYRF